MLALLGAAVAMVSIYLLGTMPSPVTAAAAAAADGHPTSITVFMEDIAARTVTTASLDQSVDVVTATLKGHTESISVAVPDTYLHDTVAALIAAKVPLSVTGTPMSTDNGLGVGAQPATHGAATPLGPDSGATVHTVAYAQSATGVQSGSTAVGTTGGTFTREADTVVTTAVGVQTRPANVATQGRSTAAASAASAASAAAATNDRRQTRMTEGILGLMLALTLTIFSAVLSSNRRMNAARSGRSGRPTDGAAGNSAAVTLRGGRRGDADGKHAGGRNLSVPADKPTTRFRDVAGCNEAVADLQELVLFLRDPGRFTRTGAAAPKGALLVGPPGTGKTLLARAVAGEADVAFFAAAGSDFVEKYVGVGAQRVRDLFAAARQHGRAIIFIDEIDAVARSRSGDSNNGESDNTLLALLSEMDGFTASNVIVLAATNRADILDSALTRPGRLDRRVEVPNPDRLGREQILRVHTRNKPVDQALDLVALARRTPGFSGAQLKALVNEACLDAVRRDLDFVTADCFDHAVATIAMGRARTSALVTDHDREVTAWHEGGHTMAAYLLPDADDPVQVTIVPRGPAGGVTWMSGSDDIFLTRRKAHAQLVVALAGRAAEEVLLGGEFTQGASGDLQTATGLAHQMATQFGMTRLGYQVLSGQHANAELSEVVEELLAHAHAEATQLMVEHRSFLAGIATELLDRDTLTLADVRAIAGRTGATGRVMALPLPNRPPRGLTGPSADRSQPPVVRPVTGDGPVDAASPGRAADHTPRGVRSVFPGMRLPRRRRAEDRPAVSA